MLKYQRWQTFSDSCNLKSHLKITIHSCILYVQTKHKLLDIFGTLIHAFHLVLLIKLRGMLAIHLLMNRFIFHPKPTRQSQTKTTPKHTTVHQHTEFYSYREFIYIFIVYRGFLLWFATGNTSIVSWQCNYEHQN